MRTTDRIQTVFPEPDKDLDPADIFHDGLGSIFSDTVQDQHGDPSAVILYKSEKYGILKLKVVDPNEGGEWKLFAHYVWNAGVRMAVLVGQEEHIIEESKRWQWNVEGQMVLELGSGMESSCMAEEELIGCLSRCWPPRHSFCACRC